MGDLSTVVSFCGSKYVGWLITFIVEECRKYSSERNIVGKLREFIEDGKSIEQIFSRGGFR